MSEVPRTVVGVNPRAEAQGRLARVKLDAYEVRVLEPAPPAVVTEPWFADDPVARGDGSRPVVSPVPGADARWIDLARKRPQLASFCQERWLGPYRRLTELPVTFTTTTLALHEVARHVVAPARERAVGHFGLRYTRGGFGTPFFGDGVQVRVEGDTLHVQDGRQMRAEPLTTVAAAACFTGGTHDDERELTIDDTAARALGDWFGFAFSVLEELRAEAGAAHEPSRVQLWPEHFDAALELGSEAGGTRAAYGCSPGDSTHPDPYLYVAPWVAPSEGALWNARGFPGAELPHAALLDAGDQRGLALEFFGERLRALT